MRATALIAVLALVMAGCTSGDSTKEPGPFLACGSDEGYPGDESCANVGPDDPAAPTEQSAVGVLGSFMSRDPSHTHFCAVVRDQLFVLGGPGFEPDSYPIEEITSGAEIDSESSPEAQDAVDFFLSSPVSLYRLTSGDDLFDVIAAINSDDAVASPHYILSTSPRWKYGPDNAATPVSGDWSDLDTTGVSGGDVAAEPASDSSRVVVVDTGSTPDIVDIGIPFAPEEEELVFGQTADYHGTFAASIVRQFDPGLRVDVYRASFSDALLTEASVVSAVLRSQPAGGDVVNLSLGTYACNPELPTLGLIQVMADSGAEFTAASGNDSISGDVHEPMFPAAAGFDDFASKVANRDVFDANGIDLSELSSRVTAVGAVSIDWQSVAEYSNLAEIYAPGTNVIGWRAGGLAAWSGTSFAAPHFAACLAAGLCEAP